MILGETITKHTFNNLQIRCWRQMKKRDDKNQSSIDWEEIFAVLSSYPYPNALSPNEIAEGILAMDRMNAVEVKNIDGIGVVFYKDWP